MKEEIINLMPNNTIGLLLKTEDRYEVISTGSPTKDRVLIDTKMIPTGEWMHTFTNKKDSPVVIKIFRNE